MLKNLKSLFIVEEESEKKENKEGVRKETPKKGNEPPKAKTPPITPSGGGVVDQKITDKLFNAIEENNQEGFDYLEYKLSLKSLEKLPMDEATKYRSAFATASTIGATLDKLLESAQHYLKVLQNEEHKFTQASDQQARESISRKVEEIATFKKMIDEKSKQIKKLTEEITSHQRKIEDMSKVIEESKQKIQITKDNFEVSYLSLKKQIETDTEKMKQYLR